MMKIILLLFCSVMCVGVFAQTNYYVRTDGLDAVSHTGLSNTSGVAWKTVAYAAATAPINSIINVGIGQAAAIFIEGTTKIVVKTGVTIQGVDTINTKLVLSHYDSSVSLASIELTSGSVTNGAQTIQNMWIDGNNFTAYNGILVLRRSHVILRNLKLTNFKAFAVNFNNTLADGVFTYADSSQFKASSILDCGNRHKVGGGGLLISGQHGMVVDSIRINNSNKPQLQNGNCITMVQGRNKGLRILNSTFTKPVNEGEVSYSIESWKEDGGYEVAYCTFNGGGNQIDAGTGGARKGAYAYSWWVHDCTFQMAAQLPGSANPQYSMGFQFEDSVSDSHIEYNHFLNLGMGIVISNTHGPMVTQRHTINNNLFENMGVLDGTYSGWGAIYILISPQSPFGVGAIGRDFDIYNNTVKAKGGRSGLYLAAGAGCFIRNVSYTNNIVDSVTSVGYIGFAGSGTTFGGSNTTNGFDTIYSKNNISWQNAFTNNAFYVAPQTAATVAHFVTTVNGVVGTPIKQDPLFIGNADYHLQAASPGATGNSPGGLNPPNTYIGRYPAGGALIVPTITWAPGAITYLTTFAGSMTASTGVAGTFRYYNGVTEIFAATVLPAAVYSNVISVTFTPTDPTTYATVSKTLATFTVNAKNETLSYSALNKTYTGAGQAPTVTSSPDAIAATYISTTYTGLTLSYGPTTTPPIAVGTYQVTTGINSALTTNYTATTITSSSFIIAKATATFTITNTSAVYDSSQKAISVATVPAGLTGVVVTYTSSNPVYNSTTPPTRSGVYNAAVALVGNANYTATTVNQAFTIAKGTATVSWLPQPIAAITYPATLTGTQLNATASDPTGAVAGVFTYSHILGEVLNAGASQSITVGFVATDTNYNAVVGASNTITVNKGVATITFTPATLAQVFDGNPNPVTYTISPAGLITVGVIYTGISGTTYGPSATAPTLAGTYNVTATLNNLNYTATQTGTLVVSPASGASIDINSSSLSQVYTGVARDVTVTTVPATGVTYTITYSPVGHTNAGSYTAIATITAGGTGADTATLVITKALPVVVYAPTTPITFGTAMNTTASTSPVVAGAFTYNPVIGFVPNAGVTNATATFTPTDLTNYSVAQKTVPVTVTKASASIGIRTASLTQQYNGTPRLIIDSTSPVGLAHRTTYNGLVATAIYPVNAGTYAVRDSITNANYTATTATGTLVVSKGMYTLTWSTPSKMKRNTPLTSTQLSATSTIPGVFVYRNAAGTVVTIGTILPGGSNLITATFTPTDLTNYSIGTISVTIQVVRNPINNVLIVNTVIVNK